MANSTWSDLVRALEDAGVKFDKGLTDSEVCSVESLFGFRFPPDLREFLQAGLPMGKGFPDWRHGPGESLREQLEIPLEGILFDVQHNGFWLPEWGLRPADLDDAKETVRRLVAAAPRLVPVFMHRMIPDRPHESGNPVYSVHQTDIIYYGIDLRDYLAHEFLAHSDTSGCQPSPTSPKPIEFWDIERFQDVRWADGCAEFDNRKGVLPPPTSPPTRTRSEADDCD